MLSHISVILIGIRPGSFAGDRARELRPEAGLVVTTVSKCSDQFIPILYARKLPRILEATLLRGTPAYADRLFEGQYKTLSDSNQAVISAADYGGNSEVVFDFSNSTSPSSSLGNSTTTNSPDSVNFKLSWSIQETASFVSSPARILI